MESLHFFDNKKNVALWWLKPYILTAMLAILWGNFSYSQENWSVDWNKTELRLQERNIETFFGELETRNLNISGTSEKTTDVYARRMQGELEYELSNNAEVIQIFDTLVNILNTKYSQNISNDNYLLVLQSAFKILSKNEKYIGLNQFSDRCFDSFDINFVNALQFVQYINWLSYNWSLKTQRKAWKSVLQCMIDDLSNQTTYQNNWQNNLINNENSDIVNNLSNKLSIEKLNWINYEDVLHMVNSIRHEWLRKAVMASLLNNDVIWAQKLLWMDLHCDPKIYPGFVANKRIWRKELSLMEEHWQYMTLKDSQEVLNYFKSIEENYKLYDSLFYWYEPLSVYKKFLSWEWKFNNHWLPYCIVSKYDYTLYLFSADHKLILETPVLTWAVPWNTPHKQGNKTTPWWSYTVWWIYTWKDLFKLYHTDFIRLDPNEWQYLLELNEDWNYKSALWIHWEWILRWYKVVIWKDWKKTLVEVPRSELFESNNSASHNTTGGCTNVQVEKFWILINNLCPGCLVYYCFDDEINRNEDLWYYPENELEMIDYFGNNSSENFIKWDDAKKNYSYKNIAWNNSIFTRRLAHRHNPKTGVPSIEMRLKNSYLDEINQKKLA